MRGGVLFFVFWVGNIYLGYLSDGRFIELAEWGNHCRSACCLVWLFIFYSFYGVGGTLPFFGDYI